MLHNLKIFLTMSVSRHPTKKNIITYLKSVNFVKDYVSQMIFISFVHIM